MSPHSGSIPSLVSTFRVGRYALRFLANILLTNAVVVALCALSFAGYEGGNTVMFTAPTGWNYAPANFADTNNMFRVFWCGEGTVSGIGSTDVIYYRNYNYSTGQWSSTYTALEPTPGSWEDNPAGAGTCNPSVVKGSFSPGNGNTYTYAMYYVAGKSQAFSH